MTHSEYEQSKKRLEEQRRAGVELVEKAFESQMRALEVVWLLQGGVAGSAAPPAAVPPPAPERPRHRTASEVAEDVGELFHSLPARFSRRDVCDALGYEPDRGALYKALQALAAEGYVEIEAVGKGQRGTLYRKTDAAS